MADGAINAAKGTRGGLDGASCRNYLRRGDGSLEELPACADIILKPGENVVSYCTGGGGYGPPTERPAEKVKYDVDEKWITKERAHEIYGVVLNGDGSLDEAATAERRRALSGA